MSELEKVKEFARLYSGDIESELMKELNNPEIDDIKSLKIIDVDEADGFFAVIGTAIIVGKEELIRASNGDKEIDHTEEKAEVAFKVIKINDGYSVEYYRNEDGTISFEQTFPTYDEYEDL